MSDEQIGLHEQLRSEIKRTRTDVETSVLHRLLQILNGEGAFDVVDSPQNSKALLGLPQTISNEELLEPMCYGLLYRVLFAHTGTKVLLSCDIAKKALLKILKAQQSILHGLAQRQVVGADRGFGLILKLSCCIRREHSTLHHQTRDEQEAAELVHLSLVSHPQEGLLSGIRFMSQQIHDH